MPLGVVVSLLAGAWWIGSTMSGVQHEVALLRRDLNQVVAVAATRTELEALRRDVLDLQRMMAERVTWVSADAWCRELEASRPQEKWPKLSR